VYFVLIKRKKFRAQTTVWIGTGLSVIKKNRIDICFGVQHIDGVDSMLEDNGSKSAGVR